MGSLVLLALLALPGVLAQEEGQPCQHQRLGLPGTCKFIADCPSAIAERKKNINPQICGFRPSSLVPNVCCLQPEGNVIERDQPPTGRISRKKCREYAEAAQRYGDCPLKQAGPSTVHKLIVNGVPAEPKEFPHMALLGYGSRDSIEYSCAGSLISERWVLTAAHCLSHPNHGIVRWALMGDLDTSVQTDDARPQLIAVDEVVRHPQFRQSLRYHDIALLRLQRAPELNLYVRPACVFTDPQLAVATNLTVSGWGTTDFADDQLSTMLLKARLSTESRANCNKSYAAAIRQPGSKLPDGISDSQLCAGSTTGKDACQGDSGGPLQLFTDENPTCMQHVVGVVSLGIFCGSKDPGVYTKVAAYTNWIERVVWPD